MKPFNAKRTKSKKVKVLAVTIVDQDLVSDMEDFFGNLQVGSSCFV